MVTAPPKPEDISHETIAFIEEVKEFYEAVAMRDELIERTSKWVRAIIRLLNCVDGLQWHHYPTGWGLTIEIYPLKTGDEIWGQTQLGCLLNIARNWNIYEGD